MRSSRWHAQGNVYLVTDDGPLTPDGVRQGGRRRRRDPRGLPQRRRLARDRDLEPRRVARGDVGQRHAHRGALAERAHGRRARRRSASGPREVRRDDARRRARRAGPRAPSTVGERRGGRRAFASSRSTSATRTRSSTATPRELPADRPAARGARAVPAAHERPGRRRLSGEEIEARVWERGAGETASSGSSAVAVAAAFGKQPVDGALSRRRARRSLRGRPRIPDRARRAGELTMTEQPAC